MKIVSWNVNGIRAAYSHGLPELLQDETVDIFAFQETKVDLPLYELVPEGYTSFWSCCKTKKGYSGTACFVKEEPLSVSYKMDDRLLDYEGRIITLEYINFFVVNCYAPNPFHVPERSDYRQEWDEQFLLYIQKLNHRKPVIICGDFNATLSDSDIYAENKNSDSGNDFQALERENLLKLIELGHRDAYREIHPDEEEQYTWWSPRQNKRQENRGWRLDYFFVSDNLRKQIRECDMMSQMYGSDHCPIYLEIDLVIETLHRFHLDFNDEGIITQLFQKGDLSDLWDNIDWKQAQDELFSMQQQLAKAAHNGESVTKWQGHIISSLNARLLAVRHICNSASGPGVDGVRWQTSHDKMIAAMSLSPQHYHALPARLMFLETKGGKTRRIHLETWKDRAMQTLYAYALDPIAEVWDDPYSFAFHKGRSTFDMNEWIKTILSGEDAPAWVLVSDVRQCYDSISHQWMLEHIPMQKKVLQEFLKAGYIFSDFLYPSDVGVGVGCRISPIIANMTLCGLKEFIQTQTSTEHEVIRYADDIIITARSFDEADALISIVNDFLRVRGLALSEKKTRIINTNKGFEFMSRRYVREDDQIVVYPSEKAVERFLDTIKETIFNHSGSQQSLIRKLNQKITGWTTYHKVEENYSAFQKADNYITVTLLELCAKKHPKWSMARIIKKYWYREADGTYYFALPNKKEVRVKHLTDMIPVLHRKVNVRMNPYLHTEYFERRTHEREIHNVTGIYRAIWLRQEGRCAYCGRKILRDQEKQIVNIRETGKKVERFAYIHASCSDRSVEYICSDTEPASSTELMELLNKLQKGQRPAGQKFLPLSKYFLDCTKPIFTLTFEEIENILGKKLGTTKHHHTFWRRTGFECISQAWLESGYEIQALHLDEERIVFHQTQKNTSSVHIPDAILSKRVPDAARYEIENYLAYIVKKYGL